MTTFNPLDYLGTPVKETPTELLFFCPSCQNGNNRNPKFSVNKESNHKYRCFKGCSKEAIREILAGKGVHSNRWQSGDKETRPSILIASPDKRHEIYSQLIQQLGLSEAHKTHLKKERKLKRLKDRGYFSIPAKGLEWTGSNPKGVPGAYLHETIDPFTDQASEEWRFNFYTTGIGIPVRDVKGRITAVQIRLDKKG